MNNGTDLYLAKTFAEKAGVTVRTLHFYDRERLLEPAGRTASGYRLYGQAQLERLEQILALRFVGFPITQIKELLQGRTRPLGAALRLQRRLIQREQRRLESVARAIESAERALESGSVQDRWNTLRTVIEGLRMQNKWEWMQDYFSDEARDKIAAVRNATPKETIEQGQRDWAVLIAEVEEAALTEDPKSSHAQSLATRWRALLEQFTQGDPEIQEGLNRLYGDRANWPKDFKRPYSDRAEAFIKAALDASRLEAASDS